MSHKPIRFGAGGGIPDASPKAAQRRLPEEGSASASASGSADEAGVDGGVDGGVKPVSLDLKKEVALTVTWSDGRVSVYPVGYLRRMSPSAEARQLREQMASNPLTVLPGNSSPTADDTPFAATGAELVGHYAIRIEFSDGHRTGIYTWSYLREIDPGMGEGEQRHVDPDARVKP